MRMKGLGDVADMAVPPSAGFDLLRELCGAR